MGRIGVVGIPNGWSSRKLVDAFLKRGCECRLIDMRHVVVDFENGRVLDRGEAMETFDALVLKKIGSPYSPHMLDRLEMLAYAARRGVRIFSDPRHIKRVLDRLSCTVRLCSAGVPMPPTVITEDTDEAVEAVKRFEKAILKPIYTSKARGMVVVTAGDDVAGEIERFRAAGHQMLYIQKLLSLPGHDMGIVFVGGKLAGTYARVGAGTSWNTSTHSGGRYEPCEPDAEVLELARRAQEPFELDFTCVDVAVTERGPVVFEVSAFGGFRGLQEGCGVDAAGLHADHVLRRLRDG
ncbi:MAG: GAK system ATP-grasp enzyme [Phycisphaerae bacterium]|jgi:ribosomal protein S6--L-glutamate ligase